MNRFGRILVLFWISVPAFAGVSQSPEGAAPPPPVFDPLSSTYLFKMMLSLFVVLLLMFVVVWFLKRTGRFEGGSGGSPLHVLAQMSVGTRERVLLIAVGDRQMMLGVSHGQIESLGWVDPPIEVDRRLQTRGMGRMDSAFARLLQNQIGKKTHKDERKEAVASAATVMPASASDESPSESRS